MKIAGQWDELNLVATQLEILNALLLPTGEYAMPILKMLKCFLKQEIYVLKN